MAYQNDSLIGEGLYEFTPIDVGSDTSDTSDTSDISLFIDKNI